nr:MAG TPA: hypothetical protein [Caudoviricetes sp.]
MVSGNNDKFSCTIRQDYWSGFEIVWISLYGFLQLLKLFFGYGTRIILQLFQCFCLSVNHFHIS